MKYVPSRYGYRFALLAVMLGTMLVPSLVLASPPTGAVRSAALSSLVLHKHDLPASFGSSIKEGGLSIDNINQAGYLHTSAATLAQHGRVGGYLSILGSHDPSHAFSIEDNVDRYRTTAGAHWQLLRDKSLHGPSSGATRLSTSGIGDEAWGYTAFGPTGSGTAGVYFRRGKYWARVYVLTFSPISATDILRLARTMDGRIKRAG